MKHILSLLILLGPLTLISQTQYLDQYEGIFITSANTTATQDQGWVTVADVKLDSITQRLAVIKFDMCGDIQWSNFYSSENAEFHHAEIIQNGSQGYHITCSDEDLSKGPQGVYMIELNSNGMVTSAIQHSTEGQMISGYFIGTDMAIINNTDILTEYETDNGNKALALFDEDEEVVWSKSYDGLPNMASPMAIEAINDSMVFVTNTFQVALMDTLGEVIWSMKNDSVVIWPEIAYLEDNTIGILVSPLKVDSVERAESRRYTYLVTFPQATPFPVMHKGDTKLLDFFPELHAVDGNFVVTSIDTIPEIESYAQTFLVYDKNGDVIEQKYLADYLTSGPLDSMPWIGFDYRSGSGYLTYADADSSVYFSKVGASLEVEDMMACMPETRDSLLDELLSYWVDNPVTVDSIMTTVDSAEVMSEPMDTLIPMRQCENMIPDNELMRPICPGDSILIGGIWRKEEGTYMDTTIICGEEVITTYEVTFIMIPDINIDTSFCPGEEELRFTQFGNVRVITEPGVYVDTIETCNQEVIRAINASAVMVSDVEFTVEICEGDSALLGGVWRSDEGEYRTSFIRCGQEVDSIMNLNFVPGTPDPDPVERSTCPGDTIQHTDRVNGTLILTRDTSFEVVVQDFASGCPNYTITERYEYSFNEATGGFRDLIPNAFTPNGDMINDRFMVNQDTMATIQVESFEMKIYNRWGQEVYATNNIDAGWDGRHEGEDAVAEVYLYVIEFFGRLDDCEIQDVFTGDVTLIR